MRIPQLQFNQQYAKIEMTSSPARMNIRQHKADLDIRQPRGKLEMRHRDVRVEIDNYPFRYDLGIKKIGDFIRDEHDEAKSDLMKAINKYARQGDKMMRLDKKGNILREIFIENSTPEKKELGIKWLRGPKFKVIPAKLEINYTPRKAQIKTGRRPPEIDFQRGRVEIKMAQYQAIDFYLTGGSLDEKA